MKKEFEIITKKNLFDSSEFGKNTLINSDNLSVDYYNLNSNESVRISLADRNGTISYADLNKELVFIILDGKVEFEIDGVSHEANKNDVVKAMGNLELEITAISEAKILYIAPTRIDSNSEIIKLLESVKEAENRDVFTKGHNKRVGKYSELMMKNIDPTYVNTDFFFAASMHDIGKIKIPLDILNKPGKLTVGEWDIVKMHPIYSYELLKDSVGEEAAAFAKWHHERLDGSGYPDGLKGDQIPLESRIMAVADVFDAITSKRSYRDMLEVAEAFEVLEAEVLAHHLDERCVQALKVVVYDGEISLFDED